MLHRTPKSYSGQVAGWSRHYMISFLILCLFSACETVPVSPPDQSGDPGDTPTEEPPPNPPPPGAPSISVTPSEVTLDGIGNTILLTATAETAPGQTDPSPDLTWTSEDESVASVSSGGLVTAVGEGTTFILVTYQTLADTATIHVQDEGLPPPPPPGAEWDQELANVTIEGDVVVPDGEAWLIGANVEIAGNLRTTGGTIGMRPGSSLQFLGAIPDDYVGGGMTYGPEFANDIGLWVGGEGILDIQGTPKEAWNRTGIHESWEPDDEYWITPTDVGDFKPRRWYPGDPIPQADSRVPAAEVINVTRDIVIEGPAHIHIHSQQPQRIEYVQLRRMGVSAGKFEGPALGRYALHLHINGDGSRGTIIRGVAAVESEGRVFVPHASHGITMIDNVSVNSYAEALWWDDDDRTDDLLVDRMVASGVHMPREVSGGTSYISAIDNRGGDNMTMTNSVASGAYGSGLSNGFNWPSDADNAGPAMWIHQNNVAHNNEGAGARFWFNNSDPHQTEDLIAYRNKEAGIETGAYVNSIRYDGALLVDNNIIHHSNSKPNSDGGPGASYKDVQVYTSDGYPLVFKKLTLPSQDRLEFVDCVLDGTPKVLVESVAENPLVAAFRRCGMLPDDIVFADPIPSSLDGSSVIIEHEDGREWEITVENGTKVVTQIN